MALTISQETFDEAVKENIEFGMTPQEAIEDTIKQFEAQGVNLGHIIKDPMAGGAIESHVVTEAVIKLGNLAKEKENKAPTAHLELLQVIKSECDKGLEYRVVAGKDGAYNAIIDTMTKLESDKEVLKECLKTLTSLMVKQPDLLDQPGVDLMMRYLDSQKNGDVQKHLLKWIKECCVLHEFNRQKIFDGGILNRLKLLLKNADENILKEVLGVLRALVLDDDVRVEFGRSHDHARAIASDTLCSITELLSKFKQNEAVMNDIMLTLSSLLVRTEFCKKVEDAGGLKVIKEAMVDFSSKDKIIKQCFKLLKALAGNDECKNHIIQNGLSPIMADCLSKNISSLQTCINGLGCVAALSLRSPENSRALFDAGFPDIIVNCLKAFPDNANVQKNGSWAVRNMVSRSRNQNPRFLALGVEPLLHEALKKHKSCEYDIKAALRDLGCIVDLKEEWTGKGGLLSTQNAKKK